jgi:hypothetical protein
MLIFGPLQTSNEKYRRNLQRTDKEFTTSCAITAPLNDITSGKYDETIARPSSPLPDIHMRESTGIHLSLR